MYRRYQIVSKHSATVLAVAVLAMACGGCRRSPGKRTEPSGPDSMGPRQPPEAPERTRPRPTSAPKAESKATPGASEERGVTFFVAADTHFGYPESEPLNRTKVRAMNSLPGTLFPGTLGGRVGRPRGVLVAGDLTQDGKPSEWRQFVRYYGLKGGDGLLKYPVFEATGNHDYRRKRFVVANGVRRRHGSLNYTWSWNEGGDKVHLFCLDTHPRFWARRWLRQQLARVGKKRPIVLYFHYSLKGPFSTWWANMEKRAFRRSIEGYNVIAIFHGHYHRSERYPWEGFDVYNVGSPLYDSPSFAVVRVTANHLTVAAWNYVARRWDWWHRKRIRR